MPRLSSMKSIAINISSARGSVGGLLHPANTSRAAAILLSDAQGGIEGPSAVYEELATRLQSAGVISLRLDYRVAGDLEECVYDVLRAIAALRNQGVERVSLVGWGFGGLVALTAGAVGESVTGVATLAGEGDALDLVSELAPRRLLLIHGASDQVIPASASRALYATAAQPKELIVYPEADHTFADQRAELLDKLTLWNRRLLLTPYTSRPHAHAAS